MSTTFTFNEWFKEAPLVAGAAERTIDTRALMGLDAATMHQLVNDIYWRISNHAMNITVYLVERCQHNAEAFERVMAGTKDIQRKLDQLSAVFPTTVTHSDIHSLINSVLLPLETKVTELVFEAARDCEGQDVRTALMDLPLEEVTERLRNLKLTKGPVARAMARMMSLAMAATGRAIQAAPQKQEEVLAWIEAVDEAARGDNENFNYYSKIAGVVGMAALTAGEMYAEGGAGPAITGAVAGGVMTAGAMMMHEHPVAKWGLITATTVGASVVGHTYTLGAKTLIDATAGEAVGMAFAQTAGVAFAAAGASVGGAFALMKLNIVVLHLLFLLAGALNVTVAATNGALMGQAADMGVLMPSVVYNVLSTLAGASDAAVGFVSQYESGVAIVGCICVAAMFFGAMWGRAAEKLAAKSPPEAAMQLVVANDKAVLLKAKEVPARAPRRWAWTGTKACAYLLAASALVQYREAGSMLIQNDLLKNTTEFVSDMHVFSNVPMATEAAIARGSQALMKAGRSLIPVPTAVDSVVSYASGFLPEFVSSLPATVVDNVGSAAITLVASRWHDQISEMLDNRIADTHDALTATPHEARDAIVKFLQTPIGPDGTLYKSEQPALKALEQRIEQIEQFQKMRATAPPIAKKVYEVFGTDMGQSLEHRKTVAYPHLGLEPDVRVTAGMQFMRELPGNAVAGAQAVGGATWSAGKAIVNAGASAGGYINSVFNWLQERQK